MQYNLKNDVLFKAFFSRKGNEVFLIDFLEALLEIKIDRIKIEQEVNLGRFSPQEKAGSLDIQAILNDGIVVDIEMQVDDRHNILARTMFYAAKQVTRLTPKGEEYENLKKIIMINILNYELFPFEDYRSKAINVMAEHRDFVVIEGIEWHFIELPKFRKSHPNMDDKVNQWLAIIDGMDEELMKMAEQKNQLIRKAKVEFVELTGDEETRRIEDLKDKWKRDHNSVLSYVRKESIQKGLEKGLKQGIKQGVEQGQQTKSIEIAKKMLKSGIDVKIIVQCTGLTKEEIEKLRDKNKS